jgi:hypothetical protein
MSTWRVEQHYGFGAARIPIHPEPHRSTRSGLREGFADLHHEFVDGGTRAALRRTLAQSPAFALGFLLIAAFVLTMLRDHSDYSPIEVVLLENAPIADLLPEPIPLAVEPPPLPMEPEPVERVEPKAEPLPPPPQILAERPKPPPPARVKPRSPEPPPMPEIARVEPKPPPPQVRPNRPERVQPMPAAKPRIAVDALVQRVEPPPPSPKRGERVAAVAPIARPKTPRLDAPSAPSVAPPPDAPPPRGFRVAAAPNVPRARAPRVMPGLAPSPQSPAAPAQASMKRIRPDGPTPKARAVRVAPALAAAPSVAPPSSARPSAPVRLDNRPAPTNRARRSPRPEAQLARAPANLPPPRASAAPVRVSRASHQESPRGASAARPGLAGVPLADLAVCMSDREEDRLKQAVVAAVTTQEECVSRAGTYRFVETKNLNSFLMWIDRASGRSVGDRCDELRYALECLESAGKRAAR